MSASYRSILDPEPDPSTLGPPLEETKLYKLITLGTRQSLRDAWRLVANLEENDVTRRSSTDRSTYLHAIVNVAPEVRSTNVNFDQILHI